MPRFKKNARRKVFAKEGLWIIRSGRNIIEWKKKKKKSNLLLLVVGYYAFILQTQ